MNIEDRLKRFKKDELITLTQMLGIKPSFSSFRKESDLINAILSQERKDVAACLNLLFILKVSDIYWIRKTFELELDLRRKNDPDDDEKIAGMPSRKNVKTIKKVAEKLEYKQIAKRIFPKGLSEIIIGGCLLTFLLSFYSDFGYVAAIISIITLGFALFTAIYTSPLAVRRRITIEYWQIISIAIAGGIVLLMFYTLFKSYPEFERKEFISNWAGNVATIIGFLFGAVLYFCERQKLKNWWRKHSGKIMLTIIFTVIAGFIYVEYFIIKGTAAYNNNEPLKKTTIELKGNISGFQNLCEYKGKFFYEWFIEKNNFCETKTNDNGDFSFRFFPFLTDPEEFKFKIDNILYDYPKDADIKDVKLNIIKTVNKISGTVLFEEDKEPVKGEISLYIVKDQNEDSLLAKGQIDDKGEFSPSFVENVEKPRLPFKIRFQIKLDENTKICVTENFENSDSGHIKKDIKITKKMLFGGRWQCDTGENITINQDCDKIAMIDGTICGVNKEVKYNKNRVSISKNGMNIKGEIDENSNLIFNCKEHDISDKATCIRP